MRKILYYTFSLDSGGVESYSINLYRSISKDELDFDFITFYQRKEFFDEKLYQLNGNKIPLIQKKSKSRWKDRLCAMVNLYMLVRKNSYEIAYFNFDSPASILKYPLICRLAGVNKIIVHSHNAQNLSISPVRRGINFICRKLSNVIVTKKLACSSEAAKWMFGTTSNVYDVKNGIEVENFTYNKYVREQIRRELGISEEVLVLGSVARFHKQKNHTFILRVLKTLVDIRPNVLLITVGEGALERQIRELAKELGISDKVLFLGTRTDIPQLLQAMDVLVMPSLFEGLPIAGIEAQASGLKCLVADTISRELDITGNVEFLRLIEEEWVQSLSTFGEYERHDMTKSIVAAGYNIRYTAELIQEILCSL